jgi:hypothetical protein
MGNWKACQTDKKTTAIVLLLIALSASVSFNLYPFLKPKPHRFYYVGLQGVLQTLPPRYMGYDDATYLKNWGILAENVTIQSGQRLTFNFYFPNETVSSVHILEIRFHNIVSPNLTGYQVAVAELKRYLSDRYLDVDEVGIPTKEKTGTIVTSFFDEPGLIPVGRWFNIRFEFDLFPLADGSIPMIFVKSIEIFVIDQTT